MSKQSDKSEQFKEVETYGKHKLTVGWRKCEGGVKSECWVRWTSPDGFYFWLHPFTGQWLGEPMQETMPTFATFEKAVENAKLAEPPKQKTRRVWVDDETCVIEPA